MKKLLSICFSLTLAVQLLNAQTDLVITEIMYNPPEAGTDSLEFVEIYNKGAVGINVNNYTFTQGVTYTFPNTTIAAGTYYVVAVDSAAFNNVFGFDADGIFGGGLSNAGEDIVIKSDLGVLIDSVDYNDAAPWPAGSSAGEPDGGGSSLILCDENTDNNDGNNWAASSNSVGVTINGFPVLASPGAGNSCPSCTPTFGIDPRSECDSLTWTNGVTYYADNFTAKDTLVNAAGCDSIVTLDLSMNYTSTGTDIRTECDSLVWIDSNTYYTNNNTATFVLNNSTGCDSIITLNLTITGTSTSATDVQVACDSLTWLDGNTYTSDNTTATFITSNAQGCDSIITLDLTVNYSVDVTDTLVACDSLVWIDGITYNASNNSAMVVDTTINGCDSIIRLDLTIHQTTEVTINPFSPDSICSDANAINLPAGTPAGGTYSGPGVSGNMFDPTLAGVGMHYVVYTYSDSNSCTSNDSSSILVQTCVGIDKKSNQFEGINVYPNPTEGMITVNLEGNDIISYTVFTIDGRIINQAQNITGNILQIDLKAEGKGVYFLRVENHKSNKVFKVIKQ